MSDFFVYVPSNSSLSTYPDNTCGDFRVNLAEDINLIGNWVCGIVEFHYPKTFYNITRGLYKIRVFGGAIQSFNFPSGYYSNIGEITEVINKSVPLHAGEKGIKLTYNEISRKITVTVQGDSYICLDHNLMSTLGFACSSNQQDMDNRVADISLTDIIKTTTEADYSYHLSTSPLYIYSSIIENVRIGDSSGPILRIVDANGEPGARICHTFQKPFYYPLRQNNFRQIQVQIRFNSGQIPVFNKGHCALVLHFKKKLRFLS